MLDNRTFCRTWIEHLPQYTFGAFNPWIEQGISNDLLHPKQSISDPPQLNSIHIILTFGQEDLNNLYALLFTLRVFLVMVSELAEKQFLLVMSRGGFKSSVLVKHITTM